MGMMRRAFLLLAASLMGLSAFSRDRSSFDAGWRFILADSAVMARPDYNDTHWRQLSLPHDWAIEGDFSAGNPSGAGGGALPGGVGWYRKTLTLPEETSINHPPSSIHHQGRLPSVP